jgi:hypothetical protein
MSESLLIWLFAGGFGLIAVLFVLWYHHIQHCRQVGADIAVIKQLLTDVRAEIGNHETGMIGQLHRYSKAITRICAKIGIAEP